MPKTKFVGQKQDVKALLSERKIPRETSNRWDKSRADRVIAVVASLPQQKQVLDVSDAHDASTWACDTSDEVVETTFKSSQDCEFDYELDAESNVTLQSRLVKAESESNRLRDLHVAKEMELVDAHAINRRYKRRVQVMAWEKFTNKMLQQDRELFASDNCLAAEISKLKKLLKCQSLILDKERDRYQLASATNVNCESLVAENAELRRTLKAQDLAIRKVRNFARMEEDYSELEVKTASLVAAASKAEAELSSLTAEVSALEASRSKLLRISQLDDELLELETRISQHRRLASLEAEVEQHEARLSQIDYVSKNVVDSITAAEASFSSILRKPLLEDARCIICMCDDKLSSRCTQCHKATCVSCIEGNTVVQSKSGSIAEKRKASRLECFNCKAHHDPRLPAFFSSGGLEDYFTVKTELAQFDLDKGRNLRSERVKKLQELAVQPRVEKTLWVERMIVKDLRTLACPACATPFESFDGCTALTCSGCSAHFCAWCLELADDDEACHRHVRVCTSNPKHGDYFAPEEQWRAHTDRRLNHKVEQYIAQLEAPISDRLRSDFRWALNPVTSK